MIDFRDKGEKEDDPNDELIEKAYPTVHNFSLGSLEEQKKLTTSFSFQVHEGTTMPEFRRFSIPLMNKTLKVVGMFWHGTRARTKL